MKVSFVEITVHFNDKVTIKDAKKLAKVFKKYKKNMFSFGCVAVYDCHMHCSIEGQISDYEKECLESIGYDVYSCTDIFPEGIWIPFKCILITPFMLKLFSYIFHKIQKEDKEYKEIDRL